jgi:hypothetical protein
MSRSAIWMVCVAVLNGISGCASCNCCAPVSGCCSSGGDYAMNDGYYPMDGGNYTGGGDCGCSGGGGGGAPSSAGMGYDAVYGDTAYGDVGQSMPMASQQYRGNMGRMSAYDMQPAQQYAGYNSSPKQIPMRAQQQQFRRNATPNRYAGNIQQAGMSTWESSPQQYGDIVQQSYQPKAPCNCGH